MISVFLALALAPTTLTLTPSDDIWVYPHAGDPLKDTYLRIWGSEGRAVAPVGGSAEDFGYSYLSFSLVSIPKGKTILSAKLELTQIADPKFSEELSQQSPVEARVLPSGFSEKTWSYSDVDRFTPLGSKDAIYGIGKLGPVSVGQDVAIIIDLSKGPAGFSKAIADAQAKGDSTISIALASSIDPQSSGFYKVYSKEESLETRRPHLVLTVEG